MINRERILIVGGGIAGLALGRALLSRGFRPEIVERAAAWPAAGAGLYVLGNGVRAVEALGLGDALLSRAAVIPHQRVLDHRGRLLSEIDLPRVWGRVGACVGIARAELLRVLVEGAAAVPLRRGVTVTAVTQTPERVSVQFDNGLTDSYDVLVGADGINSSIRRLVFGDVRPRAVGQVSWRFIAPDACGVNSWTVMLGGPRTFLMMPVGSDGLYCYADVAGSGAEDRAREDLDRAGQRLRKLFGEFAEPVPRVLSQLERVDAIHVAPIEEMDMDRCVAGRVVLVGDAAHATSPNMAQGASMALEDALILAEELSAGRRPADALAAFEARRRPRVRWVRERTHKRDRIRGLPAPLRNLALRAAGPAIYRADYRPLFDEP